MLGSTCGLYRTHSKPHPPTTTLTPKTQYNKQDAYDVLVDASAVPELQQAAYDEAAATLTVGAAVSLNRLAALLRAHDGGGGGQPPAGYPHGRSVFGMAAAHLTRIAGEQVRWCFWVGFEMGG